MGRWHSQNTVVTLENGDGQTITAGPGPGDFSMDNIGGPNNKQRVRKTNRGAHDGFVETEDLIQACSINLELENQSLTSGAAARIIDFIQKSGLYASASSVSSDTWAWKCTITMNDGVTSTTITLPECEGSASLSENPEGHQLALSFNNYQKPVFA